MAESIDWDAVIGELSKPDGWVKGDLGYPNCAEGPVCLRGALMRVCGQQEYLSGVSTEADGRLDAIIREQFPERTGDEEWFSAVAPFNDHEKTTLNDVILVCEKARGAS